MRKPVNQEEFKKFLSKIIWTVEWGIDSDLNHCWTYFDDNYKMIAYSYEVIDFTDDYNSRLVRYYFIEENQ